MEIIDKVIAEKIAKDNGVTVTKLGLRFDSVVIRLLTNIRNFISKDIPKETIVLLTVTAPIKLPKKTELEICKKICDSLNSRSKQINQESVVFQNKIHIRTTEASVNQIENFIGFVHNPDINSKWLLDLATDWVMKS